MKKDCPQHTLESKQQLKSGGLKITGARLGLLDIFKHAKKPLGVKEIAKQLKSTGVDLATLYRNIEALEKLGYVNQVRLAGPQAYYELASEHHHHIVCQNCGKIKDIKNCAVSLPKTEVKASGFAKVSRHSLEFFGICNICVKNKRSKLDI